MDGPLSNISYLHNIDNVACGKYFNNAKRVGKNKEHKLIVSTIVMLNFSTSSF